MNGMELQLIIIVVQGVVKKTKHCLGEIRKRGKENFTGKKRKYR
jgi:hypothetical protein